MGQGPGFASAKLAVARNDEQRAASPTREASGNAAEQYLAHQPVAARATDEQVEVARPG